MQTIIVIVIVAIAVLYIMRRVYRNIASKPEANCGCGCSGCGSAGKTMCGPDGQ